MPTDEEIIEQVEKLLAGPSIQQQVTKLLAEQMKHFIGLPNTESLQKAINNQVIAEIRKLLATVAPELLHLEKKLKLQLLDDGHGELTMHVTVELQGT